MKKRKNPMTPVTLKDLITIINRSQSELALMLGKALKDLQERLSAKIDATDARLSIKIDNVDEKLNTRADSLDKKFTSTNVRIDDLAFNRVKYEDHLKLIDRVDKLERTIGKKKVK
jgi:hypothetical protein